MSSLIPQCYTTSLNDKGEKVIHYVSCSGDITNTIVDFFKGIDIKINYFTIHAYERLVTEYSTGIYTLITIYIVLYGWAILRGKAKATINEFYGHLFYVVFVTAFATKWSIFSTYFYDLFTVIPVEFARSVVLSVSGLDNFDPRAPADLSAIIIYKGTTAAKSLAQIGGVTGYFMALLVFLCSLFIAVISAGLIITAKIALGLMLGFAPIFMLMALFKNTRGWFESWVRQLFTYAVIPLLVASLTALTYALLIGPLDDFIKQKEDLKASSSVSFIFVAFTVLYLFKQIQGIAAQLGSGFAMQTFSTLEQTKNMRQKAKAYKRLAVMKYKKFMLNRNK